MPCVPLLGEIEVSTGAAGGERHRDCGGADRRRGNRACGLDRYRSTARRHGGCRIEPRGLTSPTVELPPGAPLTLQLTACVVALVTVAVNCLRRVRLYAWRYSD